MYINLVDNIIELTCRKVDVSVDEEHGVQIVFEGDNERIPFFKNIISRHLGKG